MHGGDRVGYAHGEGDCGLIDVTDAILLALSAYGAVGVLTALWFCWSGVNRVDPSAIPSGLGFRMMIFPAAVGLWPLALLLARRAGGMLGNGRPSAERSTRRLHVLAWLCVPVIALGVWCVAIVAQHRAERALHPQSEASAGVRP